MSKSSNIILIGPMGAGKSSVAKQLEKLTQNIAYDSDEYIETQSGVSISWIFEKEGELGFRKREASAIQSILSNENRIVATGAGAIVTLSNRELIRTRGFAVFVDISLEEQLYRTRHRKGHRPLIDTENPRESLVQLNLERRPIYESLADFTINTSHLPTHQVASDIADAFLAY